MASGKTSDELPPGWKEFVKVKNGRKIKYFTNSVMGQKFYSKKSVIQFVNSQETTGQGASPSTNIVNSQETTDQDASPSTNILVSESIPCKSEATADNGKKDESLEWLPSGWSVECRSRKSGSSTYKIYTDPHTKCKFYSKPQVLQYLKGVEDRTAGDKQQQQIGEETFLKKQEDISQHDGSGEGKIPLSEENKNEMAKPLLKASESLEVDNHESGENENEKDRPCLDIVLSDAHEKSASEELPPGWIKQIKSRKRGPPMRKDPYYIDTTSGYAFRSKRDVARYLETRDIRSCAIRPRKWDMSGLKLIKEDTNPSTSHDGNKPKEDGGISEKSKEKGDSVPTRCTKLTASTIEEKTLVSGTANDKHEENSGSNAEGSKQHAKTVPDNVAAKSTDTDGIHEQKPPENDLDTKTKKETGKSKKRKLQSAATPGRSSKRLAGHEPEVRPDYRLTERALRAAVRKPNEVEALSEMALNSAAYEVPQQPVAEVEATGLSSLASSTAANEVSQHPVTEAETTCPSNLAPNPAQADTMAAHHSSVRAEMSLAKDLDINLEAPPENQVLEQTTGQTNERQIKEIPMSQGDYLFDPCWDFAFKTLTGAIPLEDTLQGCFPQQTGSSYAQDNFNFGLPEFELPPIFQNDVPRADPPQNNMPAGQPSTNPTPAPPGNLSLPFVSTTKLGG